MDFSRIRYAVAVVSLLFISLTVQADNHLFEAMMKVYAEDLAADPRDYQAYYSRAKLYFGQSMMDEALSDIDNAIKYFPRKEKDNLAQAYLMRARILSDKGKDKQALSDLNSALRLSPDHRTALLDRGDLLCKLGDNDKARIDYKHLLNIDPRNQYAYMGLARVESQSGKPVVARDLLSKAVNISPRDPQVYLERSAVYKDMGMMTEAVDDLVYAVSLSDSDSDALVQLMAYSRDSYQGVIEGLNRNISLQPRNGLLHYVRAIIYRDHYDFRSSLQDWNKIVDESFFNYHAVYYNRANCLFHLGRFDEARTDVKRAIEKNGDNADYYRLLSAIERGVGNLQGANEAIRQAALYNPTHAEISLERGMIAYDDGDFEQAIKYYGEAIEITPKQPYPYLARAFAQELGVEDVDAAKTDYRKVLNLANASDFYGDNLKGIAYAKLGAIAEAEAWERKLLAEKTVRNIDYFYLACMYAHLDVDKSVGYLEKAIQGGFSDYYRIHIDRYSPVTLAPIRHLSQYSDVLKKYRTALGQ